MNKKYTPSEGELQLLQIIWKKEPVSIKDIHKEISKQKEVGYTTVLKQIQRMYEKGALTRIERGRSHLYSASFKEENIKEGLFNKLKDSIFKGSALDLALHALGESDPNVDELEMLQALINQKKKEKDV